MTNTIFNTTKTAKEYGQKKLFGVGHMPLLDTVHTHFPEIKKLYHEMCALKWSESEIDFSQCLIDFEQAPKDMSEAMIKTLGWQWHNDSLAAQAPTTIIAPFEPCTEVWETEVEIQSNECLTPDHKVLTQDRGWINISDITTSDFVAQFNIDSQAISFVNPSVVFSKYYKDDILIFEGASSRFKQKVTKNHRMITYRNYGPNVGPQVVLAKDCPTNGSMSFITSGKKEGSLKILTPLERFWIAFQADGSYVDLTKYTGSRFKTIPVTFGFKKERKKVSLRSILKDLNFEFTETCNKDVTRFYVKIPLDLFMDSGKTFDWINLKDIDSEWCKEFIYELSNWDGCDRSLSKTHNKAITTYSSTTRKCIETVQTIASLAGFRSKIFTLPKVDNQNTCWQVSIVDTWYVTGNSVTVTETPYDGLVYCITVPTGAFLTKIDDIISVTGNCTHSLTYSEIVRMSFKDPNKVLSDILSQQEVYERSAIIGSVLKEIQQFSTEYAYLKSINAELPSEEKVKEILILFYFTMLCLERVKFMASFAITFTICKAGYFIPIGSAVMKICQDELEVHSEYRKEMLKELTSDELGRSVFEKLKPRLTHIIEAVVDEDVDWTKNYIFENDTKALVGTNSDIVCQMVLFFAKDVVNTYKLKTKYTFPKVHPMPHLIEFMDLSKTQMAPMEQDIVSYVTQVIDFNDTDTKFNYQFN